MEFNDPQTYELIGIAMEVHGELGPGYLESVYKEALAIELRSRNIPFKEEVPLPVFYKGQPLITRFRCDFICFGSVVIELKAISTLTTADQKQLLNYLTATRMERGLLFNFGSASLQHKRMVHGWNG